MWPQSAAATNPISTIGVGLRYRWSGRPGGRKPMWCRSILESWHRRRARWIEFTAQPRPRGTDMAPRGSTKEHTYKAKQRRRQHTLQWIEQHVMLETVSRLSGQRLPVQPADSKSANTEHRNAGTAGCAGTESTSVEHRSARAADKGSWPKWGVPDAAGRSAWKEIKGNADRWGEGRRWSKQGYRGSI